MQMKRMVAATVLALAGSTLAGCGGTSAGPESNPGIVVGAASFPESEILAFIYTDALNARGIKATTKTELRQREAYLPLIQDGTVSLMPEYTGNLLLSLRPGAKESSAGAVYAALQGALPKELTVLTPSLAEDLDTFNVTAANAKKYDLHTVADLTRLGQVAPGGKLRLAGNVELKNRPYGPAGLLSVYGLRAIEFVPINDGGGSATVAALISGAVDVADIYSTSPAIATEHLYTLTDPDHLVLPQQIVPLIRRDAFSGAVGAVLSQVSARLTTAQLQILLSQVQGPNAQTPAAVAAAWVNAVGLGSPGTAPSSPADQGTYREPGQGPTP